MKRNMKTRSLLAASAGLFVAMTVAPAYAQATRTWVSGVGDDANPCSRTAPCKTYAGAISKTAAGGEISTLDPGGFGGVTITKSITINGDGTLAGILVAGVNAIIVNAAPTDKVIIRNVSIVGAGTGISGIRVLSAKEVVVEHVTIDGFTASGIDFAAGSANPMSVFVRSSRITKVGTGIKVVAFAGGNAVLTVDHTDILQATNGIELGANGVFATVRDSSLVQNSSNGLLLSGASAQVDVANTMFQFNTTGLNLSVGGTAARVASSQFFNNSLGLSNAGGGTTLSNGQNVFAGNSGNGAFTGSVVVQ
jgi:hypothetical protein